MPWNSRQQPCNAQNRTVYSPGQFSPKSTVCDSCLIACPRICPAWTNFSQFYSVYFTAHCLHQCELSFALTPLCAYVCAIVHAVVVVVESQTYCWVVLIIQSDGALLRLHVTPVLTKGFIGHWFWIMLILSHLLAAFFPVCAFSDAFFVGTQLRKKEENKYAK